MMVGNRYYSEADMMRMQRDAEERVREMRNRTRQTTGDEGASFMPAFAAPPGGRNWSAGPNIGRRNNPRGRQNQAQNARMHNAARRNEAEQNNIAQNINAKIQIADDDEGDNKADILNQQAETSYSENNNNMENSQNTDADKKTTTIVEDIVGSLGVDTDTLLIIGLILILVNQKADTTLILALVYLLF